MLAATSTLANAVAFDKDDRAWIDHMNSYCQNDIDAAFANPDAPKDAKEKMAKTVIEDWLVFRRRHPSKAQEYENCISRTWIAAKKYGVDGFVDPYPPN
jgi:hypothetical protein